MTQACLYRFFDASGQMLYAGKTINPLTRMERHMATKAMHKIVHIELEWFDTEQEALSAEVAAIQQGRPLWNKRDKPSKRCLTKTMPVACGPIYLGPPAPQRTCRLTSAYTAERDTDCWQRALRISRDGDIIEIHDVEVPQEFYAKAISQEVYFVHV